MYSVMNDPIPISGSGAELVYGRSSGHRSKAARILHLTSDMLLAIYTNGMKIAISITEGARGEKRWYRFIEW